MQELRAALLKQILDSLLHFCYTVFCNTPRLVLNASFQQFYKVFELFLRKCNTRRCTVCLEFANLIHFYKSKAIVNIYQTHFTIKSYRLLFQRNCCLGVRIHFNVTCNLKFVEQIVQKNTVEETLFYQSIFYFQKPYLQQELALWAF